MIRLGRFRYNFALNCAIILSLFITSFAFAKIIEADSADFGMNSLTYDSYQDLYFLDLNYTKGLSLNYIEENIKPGGEFAGYRHATAIEINNLVNNWGHYKYNNVHNTSWAGGLVDLIGATDFFSDLTQATGIVKGDYLSTTSAPVNYGIINFNHYKDSNSSPFGTDFTQYNDVERYSIADNYGLSHFLVKDEIEYYGIFAGVKDPTNRDGGVIDGQGDAIAVMHALSSYLPEDYRHFQSFLSSYSIQDDNGKINYTGGIDVGDLTQAIAETLQKMDSNDIFIFYSSTHGGQYIDTSNLQTFEDEALFYGEHTLSDDTLARVIKDFEGVQKWLLLDACYSGGFWVEENYDSVFSDFDLNSVINTSLLASAADGKYSYAYSPHSWESQELAGRSFFSMALVEAIYKMLNDNGSGSDIVWEDLVHFMLNYKEDKLLKYRYGFATYSDFDIPHGMIDISEINLSFVSHENTFISNNTDDPVLTPEPSTFILLMLGILVFLYKIRTTKIRAFCD